MNDNVDQAQTNLEYNRSLNLKPLSQEEIEAQYAEQLANEKGENVNGEGGTPNA